MAKDRVEILKEYAESLLEDIIEDKSSEYKKYIKGKKSELKHYFTFLLYMLLSGSAMYLVESYPGAGHNYQVVVEAIHNYYKKHPGKRVDKLFNDTLVWLAQVTSEYFPSKAVLDSVSHQMYLEKNNKANFRIDCKAILSEFDRNVKVNKDKFEISEVDFESWYKKYFDYFEKEYGINL